MLTPRIAVSARSGTARIALLQNGILTQYHLWNPANPIDIGALYTGRITAAAPAMAGKFVDLGAEIIGFLPDTAGAKFLSEGQYAVFRITRTPQSGKGPRLAYLPDQPPAEKPGLLRPAPGPLLDLAETFPHAKIILDDYALIARLRPALEGRMSHQTETFHPALEAEVAALADPTATLPTGAILHFEFTKALTCIDIDTGPATAARASKTYAQLQFNLALLSALVRQIILRNLSGGILIDFAGLKTTARPQLAAPLQAALKSDPQHPKFLGFTHLGYAELLRPRLRPPLHEILLP
jgi:Ribonuclease G/E